MFLHLKVHVALGSSKPSTIESSCCGRISTRYPFQLKRKNLKDFFGGPPTFQDLSGSLSHEVSNMDADNAVTYRFYDASHHDEIGLEAFQVMLLKSGASSSNATKERCNIAEAIMSEQSYVFVDINDSDEGAKLCEILETAAEPEVLMADMTSKQLFSFSIYQAKQKEIRQSHLQKEIEKALKDAGLALREVTPFMRVRVAGLTSKQSCRNGRSRESLIIIWSPTEDQTIF
ncbi:unnamed protein product [Musa textilis]